MHTVRRLVLAYRDARVASTTRHFFPEGLSVPSKTSTTLASSCSRQKVAGIELDHTMFNAVYLIISRLDGDAPSTTKETHGGFGFQVLRNENLQLAFEPLFDFVVGINVRMIVQFTDLLFPGFPDLRRN